MIRDNPKKFHLQRYFLANRLKKVNSDPVFLSGSKRFLKTIKKLNFSVHSQNFKTRKILFWPIRENLCSRNAKILQINN